MTTPATEVKPAEITTEEEVESSGIVVDMGNYNLKLCEIEDGVNKGFQF